MDCPLDIVRRSVEQDDACPFASNLHLFHTPHVHSNLHDHLMAEGSPGILIS